MRMKQQAAQMEHQAVVAAVGKLIKVINFYFIDSYQFFIRGNPESMLMSLITMYKVSLVTYSNIIESCKCRLE